VRCTDERRRRSATRSTARSQHDYATLEERELLVAVELPRFRTDFRAGSCWPSGAASTIEGPAAPRLHARDMEAGAGRRRRRLNAIIEAASRPT
jgi:hypothetical protein